MANHAAIAGVGTSLVRLLNTYFQALEPVPSKSTTAVLVRTEDFAQMDAASAVIAPPALSLYLYRVDYNPTMRASWSAVGHADGRGHLVLDLHYLLTPWADNAAYEHNILGRALQCLEAYPSLSGPALDASAGWAPGEAVQLVMGEIATEALMRIFDSLPIDYKVSVPYVARVVRLDTEVVLTTPPVVTKVVGATPSVTP